MEALENRLDEINKIVTELEEEREAIKVVLEKRKKTGKETITLDKLKEKQVAEKMTELPSQVEIPNITGADIKRKLAGKPENEGKTTRFEKEMTGRPREQVFYKEKQPQEEITTQYVQQQQQQQRQEVQPLQVYHQQVQEKPVTPHPGIQPQVPSNTLAKQQYQQMPLPAPQAPQGYYSTKHEKQGFLAKMKGKLLLIIILLAIVTLVLWYTTTWPFTVA